MKQAYKLIALLLFVLPDIVAAQPKRLIDSLLQVSVSQIDSLKVLTLTQVSWQWRQYDRDKALRYAQEALNLARNRNDPEQIGFCWMATGNVHSYYQNAIEAFTAYQNAEEQFNKSPEIRRGKRQAQLQTNLGILYDEQLNDDAKAINAYLKAARFYEKDQNWGELSNCYTKVANLLMNQKADNQAVNYYEKALILAHRSQDPKKEVLVLNDFFSSYITWYKRQPDLDLLKKAIGGFQRGILLCRQQANQIPAQYLPTLLTNLGECHVLRNQLDLARQSLIEALRLAKPINYTDVVPSTHALLAQIDLRQGEPQAARSHMAEAEQHYGDLNWTNQSVVAQQLAELNAQQNQWADAFRWQQRYQAVSDSLGNQARNRTITALNARYSIERKDAQIAALEQETTNQRSLIGLATVLGLALLVLIWVGLRLLQAQRQLNARQQNDFELNMAQKERELTTYTLNLTTKNTLLLEIRKSLESLTDYSREALRLIDQCLQSDDNVDTFRCHFEAVHPQFFEKLQTHAQQPLSTIDMRYCAYLRMGLTTKEIANLLNIDPASIRVAKHRLKHKLGLSKEVDLTDTLKNL